MFLYILKKLKVNFLKMEWSQKLSAFEDQATTQLLKHIYSDRNSKCEKDSMAIETIQKFKEDKYFRWKLIFSVLDGKQLGKLNMKILHCACILLGNEQTSQLFAQFIHAAKNEKECNDFSCSFCCFGFKENRKWIDRIFARKRRNFIGK